MAGPLRWILELYDRVSGPAEKMTRATERFDKSMKHAGESTERMAKAQKELSAERIAVMTEFARLGAEAIEEMAIKVVEFGEELLKTADYARTTNIIFASLTGSSAGGEKLFADAEEYASKAGIKIQESVEIFRTLASSQIPNTAQNFFKLAQAAGDIGHRSNQSAVQVVQAFADISNRGQLTSLALRQFVHGIDMTEFAKQLGVASGNYGDLEKRLSDKSRPISAEVGLQAFLYTLQKMQGGTFGNITKQIGEGLGGRSQQADECLGRVAGELLEDGGVSESSRSSRQATARLEDPAFTKAINDFASSMVTAAEALEKMVPSAKTLHDTLGGGYGEKAATGLDKVSEKLRSPKVVQTEQNFGLAGLLGAFFDDSDQEDLGANAAQKLQDGFKNKNEQHSPSRVFERFGKLSAEGFEIGFNAKSNDVFASPAFAKHGGLTGATPAAHSKLELHQEINIHGTPSGMSSEDIAKRIVELSATALQSPLENLAISMGAL